jgi:hypothetical protein
MLDQIRSLRGQIIATALLFACSLPIAVGVIFARPYFEKYLQEKYTSDHRQFDSNLKSLVDSFEEDIRDGVGLTEGGKRQRDDELKMSSLENKRKIYEDWILRHQPNRARTVRRLAVLAPDDFLGWAELTIVCGNESQRQAAFRFLELSESPLVTKKLLHLATWARRTHRAEISAEIDEAQQLLSQKAEVRAGT